MNEKNIKDEIVKLEKEIKDMAELNLKFIKQKKSMIENNQVLEKEIESKRREILRYTKELSNLAKPRDSEGNEEMGNTVGAKVAVSAEVLVKEDTIIKSLLNLQKLYNQSLQVKLKQNIDALTSLQKDMRVSYVIVKRLEIKEDFLKANGLKEELNPFENLKNLARIGKLNYHGLKPCGPIMMFKINLETTFEHILKNCMEIWSNNTNFSLYDDAFNNLDACSTCNVNDFFVNYQPIDSTLRQGEVVFYMIEKLSRQRVLLESQEKSIDSKSKAGEETGDTGQSLVHQELDHCVEMIKQGKILQGVNNYKFEKIDEKKVYRQTISRVDNNIFGCLSALLFIILSLISLTTKCNIQNYSFAISENKYISWGATYSTQYTSMNDYLGTFIQYAQELQDMKTQAISTNEVIGNVRVRFMANEAYNCTSKYSEPNTLTKIIDDNHIFCILLNFQEGTWYNKDIYNFPFVFGNQTGITRNLTTPLAYYENSGVIVDLDLNNSNDYSKKLIDLSVIVGDKNRLSSNKLDVHLKAIEFSYVIANPITDVYVSNLILVESNSYYMPVLTLADSSAFTFSFYSKYSSLQTIDIIRVAAISILLLSLPLRIFQKFSNYKKSMSTFIKVSLVVILQVKFIILVVAFAFYLASFIYFITQDNISGVTDFTKFDFYQYASEQKQFIRFDILSFFLISVYFLKFSQVMDSVNILFTSIQKATFEFISLVFIITILTIGMSFLTYFVYGFDVYEYQTFTDSLVWNVKIFFFMEGTDIIKKCLFVYPNFSLFVLIIFCFVIKFYLMNIFHPIFLENFRLEHDKFKISREANSQEDTALNYSVSQKFLLYLWPSWNEKKTSIKNEDLEKGKI